MQQRHFGALEGLRALSCLSVLAFHTLVYEMYFCELPQDTSATVRSMWFLSSFGGVDVFFLLTGFLTTWQLLPPRSSLPSRVKDAKEFFFRKGVLRVYLPFVLLLVAYTLTRQLRSYPLKMFSKMLQRAHRLSNADLQDDDLVLEPLALIPFSLLFMNNLLPLNYMGWTWSLGPQFHFLYWFPRFLNAQEPAGIVRRLCQFLAAICVLRVVGAYSGLVYSFAYIIFLDPAEGIANSIASAFYYYNTVLRASPFLVGILAAIYLKRFADDGRTVRHPLRVSLLWIPVLLLIRMSNFGFPLRYLSMEPSYTNWLYNALIEPGGTLTALAWGVFLVLLLLQVGPIGQALSWFLGLRVWKPVSDASPYIFLIHVAVIEYVAGHYLGPVPMGPENYWKLLGCHAVLFLSGLVAGFLFKAVCDVVLPPIATRLTAWYLPPKSNEVAQPTAVAQEKQQ